MYSSIFSLLGAAALFFPAAATAQELIHFYNFNGDSVVDEVRGVNGTLYNGAIVVSGSLVLDGANDYVEINGKIILTNGAPFSVFIKYVSGTQALSITEMISQGYSGGPGFYIGQVNGSLRLTDNYPFGETQTPFPTGPHQLLLTSGANGTQVVIDGILVFSSAVPLNLGDNGSGTNTRIGRQFQHYAEWFNGSIDQLKIFDQVVSYTYAAAACPNNGSETINYTYDALGRLRYVSASDTGNNARSSEYQYDRAGNRTKVIMQTSC